MTRTEEPHGTQESKATVKETHRIMESEQIGTDTFYKVILFSFQNPGFFLENVDMPPSTPLSPPIALLEKHESMPKRQKAGKLKVDVQKCGLECRQL